MSINRYLKVYARKLRVTPARCYEEVRVLVGGFLENAYEASRIMPPEEYEESYGGIAHLKHVEEVEHAHVVAVIRWVGPTAFYAVLRDYAVLQERVV